MSPELEVPGPDFSLTSSPDDLDQVIADNLKATGDALELTSGPIGLGADLVTGLITGESLLDTTGKTLDLTEKLIERQQKLRDSQSTNGGYEAPPPELLPDVGQHAAGQSAVGGRLKWAAAAGVAVVVLGFGAIKVGGGPTDTQDTSGDGAALEVISSGGGRVLVASLHVSPPDRCPTAHYHGPGWTIDAPYAVAVDPDPQGCGFGAVGSTQIQRVMVTRTDAQTFSRTTGIALP